MRALPASPPIRDPASGSGSAEARQQASKLVGRHILGKDAETAAPRTVAPNPRRLGPVWGLCSKHSTSEQRGCWHLVGGAPGITDPALPGTASPSEKGPPKMPITLLWRTICRAWTSKSHCHCFPPSWTGLEHWVSCQAPFAPLNGGWVTTTDEPGHASFLSATSVLTWLHTQSGQKAKAYCLVNKALTSNP